MQRIAAQIIDGCERCNLAKHERAGPSETMHSFEVFKSGQLVAIDSLGPLKISEGGNLHVILAIDAFTRFIEAKAVPNINADTFAAFLTEYCSRFGFPKAFITDESKKFCNYTSHQLIQTLGIEHQK